MDPVPGLPAGLDRAGPSPTDPAVGRGGGCTSVIASPGCPGIPGGLTYAVSLGVQTSG